MTEFFRVVWLVMRKDLTIEVRSREIFFTTVFFAVLCVLVFAFALVREGRSEPGLAAGILWVAIAFAGTLALGRTFDRERQNETLRALMLAPVERAAIYLGKLMSALVLLAATEVLLVPLVSFLFQAQLLGRPGPILLLLGLGTVGFVAVGTLFAAMLVRVRSRDVLLPVLLYPMTIPVIIAGVRGTTALLNEPPDMASVELLISLLAFFDVVFMTLALWTFEPLMTD